MVLSHIWADVTLFRSAGGIQLLQLYSLCSEVHIDETISSYQSKAELIFNQSIFNTSNKVIRGVRERGESRRNEEEKIILKDERRKGICPGWEVTQDTVTDASFNPVNQAHTESVRAEFRRIFHRKKNKNKNFEGWLNRNKMEPRMNPFYFYG